MSVEVNKTDRIVNVTVEKKYGKSIETDIDIAGQRVGFKQEGEANFEYIDLPKLEFDDLTQAQKDSLKLTFDQLTQAEKDSLKGDDGIGFENAGKNLFNKEAIVWGYLNETTGAVNETSSSWFISDFIPVREDNVITVSPRVHKICEYNASKEFIKGVVVEPNAQTTFTTLTETKYIKVEEYSGYEEVMQIEYGSTNTSFEPYTQTLRATGLKTGTEVIFPNKEIESDVSGFKLGMSSIKFDQLSFQRGKNLFDKTAIKLGSVSHTTGIATETGSGNWFYSELIPVKPAKQIHFSLINKVWQYDENGEYIEGTFVEVAPQNQLTITTKDTTHYIRIYDYITTIDNKQIEYGSTTTMYESFNPLVKINKTVKGLPISIASGKWVDKNYLAIGDSVTEGGKYQSIVANKIGATVETHAKGGLSVVQLIDGDGDGFPALSGSQLSNKHLVTLFAGLNDRSKNIGQRGDIYPTNDTIYGRFQYAINSIFSLAGSVSKKDIRLVLITPHKVGKYNYINADGGDEYPVGSGQTLEDIVNAIKDLGGLYGLPVIDLYHTSGINDFTWDIYTNNTTSSSGPYPANPDNVHPNDKGHDLIARIIASSIENI
jgi:lysophospholipase L1-like esterase